MTNFNINTERMINHFCEMVKIKSVTFEEANMCDYLVKYLTEMGADEVYYDKCLYSIGKEGGITTGEMQKNAAEILRMIINLQKMR